MHTETPAPPVPEHDLLPVWQALDQVADPCQHACGYELSIVDLGIVNDVSAEDGVVTVSLTFTEPLCTFGFRIIQEIEDRLVVLSGVREARVSIVPFPLWEPSRLSERARALHAERRLQFSGVHCTTSEAVIPLSRIPTGARHD